MRLRSTAALLVAALSLLAAGIGCGNKQDDFTPEQQQTIDRTTSIARYSGGDWAKVKPEDREFLIKGPGSGSENNAKMLLTEMAKQQPGK